MGYYWVEFVPNRANITTGESGEFSIHDPDKQIFDHRP